MFIYKSWDQNCSEDIPKLNYNEVSDIFNAFWRLFLIHSATPISLCLEIWLVQFWTYFLGYYLVVAFIIFLTQNIGIKPVTKILS